MKCLFLAATVLAVCSLAGAGVLDLSYSLSGSAISEDFNSMGSAGTIAPGSSGGSTMWSVVVNGQQWALGLSKPNATTIGGYNGGTTSGTDRALGILDGTTDTYMVAKFTNNTGVFIDQLTLSYDLELWYNASNGSKAGGWDLYFSRDNSSYSAMGSGFNSTKSFNGNKSWITTPQSVLGVGGSYNVTNALAPGESFYIKWNRTGDTQIGAFIDNLSMSAHTIARPTLAVEAEPAATRVITGGKVGVNVHVRNTAAVGSAASNYDVIGQTTNIEGAAHGNKPADAGQGYNAHTLDFKTAGLGLGQQTGRVKVSDPYASNDPQYADVSVEVLDHGAPSFSASEIKNQLVLDFGELTLGTLAQKGFSISNLLASYRAGVDLDDISGASAFSTDLATFSNLSAGATNEYLATFNATAPGTYEETVTLAFSDENIAGAESLGTMTLVMRASVVPEPASMMLLAAGAIGLLVRRNRR